MLPFADGHHVLLGCVWNAKRGISFGRGTAVHTDPPHPPRQNDAARLGSISNPHYLQPNQAAAEVRTDMAPLLLVSLLQTVVGMASRGLRCICLTYTDYPAHDPNRAADFFEDSDRVDKDLIAMAIVGIKDPVRYVAVLF